MNSIFSEVKLGTVYLTYMFLSQIKFNFGPFRPKSEKFNKMFLRAQPDPTAEVEP